MTAVGELERATQRRVIGHFRDHLGYALLGNWHERDNNRNIEPEILTRFLKSQGHSPALITKALDKLDKAAALGGSKSLYDANRDVYSILRYGVKVRPGLGEHTVTVHLIDWANPAANDFAIAEEVTVTGKNTKRPDIVLYVTPTATVSVYSSSFATAGNDTEGRYGVIPEKYWRKGGTRWLSVTTFT